MVASVVIVFVGDVLLDRLDRAHTVDAGVNSDYVVRREQLLLREFLRHYIASFAFAAPPSVPILAYASISDPP
jgi:hypothetical protein